MRMLTFINTNGDELVMGNTNPLLVTKLEGTGAVNINIHSQKSPYQDGETYNGNTLDYRQMYIEGTILERDKKRIMQLRRTMIKVLNPKLQCRLIYEYDGGENAINCIIDGAPIFPDRGKEIYQKFIIHLYCPSPFWEDIYESGELIQTWLKGFQFPLKLPFQLKQKGETVRNIYNEGDVETPVEIIFKGPATNPSVTNVTTGEFIKVDRTLTSDDTLYITTEFGNKRVEIERNGIRENAFHYIDLDSVFFSLQPGDNLIEYNTESLEPQSVEIRYRNRYSGV